MFLAVVIVLSVLIIADVPNITKFRRFVSANLFFQIQNFINPDLLDEISHMAN